MRAPSMLVSGFCLALVSTVSVRALAEDLPDGLRKATHASTGTTDVGGAGFQEHADHSDDKDETTAHIAAGGMSASGNSRQIALTSSTDLKLRRSTSQFTGVAALNYARAAAKGEDLETTVTNVQGRIRYDYFFADRWSAFLAVTARHDKFQGLDLRLNLDPGVAFYALNEGKHALWLEAGYDLQYDIRRDQNIEADPTLDKRESRHSVRGFVGYRNQLNERVSADTGLELLESVQDQSKWRLNWDASLTSNIAGKLSTAVTVSVRYDNAPLPDIKTTDVMTSFNLVYVLL